MACVPIQKPDTHLQGQGIIIHFRAGPGLNDHTVGTDRGQENVEIFLVDPGGVCIQERPPDLGAGVAVVHHLDHGIRGACVQFAVVRCHGYRAENLPAHIEFPDFGAV